MITEEIENELREALNSLYDPGFQASPALRSLVGCEAGGGPLAIQAAIIQAIEQLKPPAGTPQTSRLQQVYELLYNRFVLQLTLQETAQRMHVSFSSSCRAQRPAVHALARVLWQQNHARRVADGAAKASETAGASTGPDTQAADWEGQARRELASLQASAPDATSDVSELLERVLDLGDTLAARHGTRLEVGAIQPDLTAAIHPSVVRQILVTAIARLSRHSPGGTITLFGRLENGNVRVSITGPLDSSSRVAADELTRDILAPEDVRLEAHVNGGQAFLWVELPPVGRVTVLVVDDNPDMARFYRRCTEKTSYHIIHTAEGHRLFETIEATAPDVIVLDVMLPDTDGWELLTRLHEDPATRSIPVVVGSVVREEELALSLGAAAFLAKPVQPRRFIRTLDRVLARAPGAVLGSPANSVEAGGAKGPRQA